MPAGSRMASDQPLSAALVHDPPVEGNVACISVLDLHIECCTIGDCPNFELIIAAGFLPAPLALVPRSASHSGTHAAPIFGSVSMESRKIS